MTKVYDKATLHERDLATKATETFSVYLSKVLVAPLTEAQESHLTGYQALQQELYLWEKHKVPLVPEWATTLGIVEELGELLEAIEESNSEDFKDAVGDFMIFTCNLCTKWGINFETLVDYGVDKLGFISGLDTLTLMWKSLGQLSHVALKSLQQIRGYKDRAMCQRDLAIVLGRLVVCVTALAYNDEESAERLWCSVAVEVMKRDWIKFPKTGLPPALEEQTA